MQRTYAHVYILDAAYRIDKRYVYFVLPEQRETIEVGSLCVVPFGNSNRRQTAVVVGFSETVDYPQVKPVAEVLEYPVRLTSELIELCTFMKERFFCTFGACVKTILPPGIGIRSSTFWSALPFERDRLNDKASFIYDKLVCGGRVSETELVCEFGDEVVTLLRAMKEIGATEKITEVKKTVNEKTLTMFRLKQSSDGTYPDPASFRSEKQKNIVDFLSGGGSLSFADGEELYGAGRSVFTTLEKNNVIERYTVRIDRDPLTPLCDEKYRNYELSDEQKNVFSAVSELMDSGEAKAALLFGVTGSGKTKVIIEACKKCLSENRSAIVLLPEIGLTAQALGIYKTVFGDRLAVVHSMLSNGERIDAYRAAASGKAKNIIGTRSAVFAPLDNIGLIAIDEEQEHTYRSDMSPKYHARDIARFRCGYHKAVMLLCSATPSVESYFKAEKGVYTLLALKNRYGGLSLPDVELADIRGDSRITDGKYIGKRLAEELKRTIDNGKQAILFASRRGYSSHLSCQSCGYVFTCPNCSVSLTYHAYGSFDRANKLICHYCGYMIPKPVACPSCGGSHIGYFGCGTQKLGEELEELFPTARAIRMDADTTGEKNSHEEILNAFGNVQYDILYGTQMVAKGLDFPNVSLVGVINADMSLFMNDFRAGERTFSLFTQLVGRAGRSMGGRAVIQTNVPDNEILNLAAAQDYERFYRSEIEIRRAVVFPPFCDMAVFSFIGDTEDDADRASTSLTGLLKNFYTQHFTSVPIVVLGPYREGIFKLKNKYRQRIIIKYRDSAASRRFLSAAYAELLKATPHTVKIELDVNQSII